MNPSRHRQQRLWENSTEIPEVMPSTPLAADILIVGTAPGFSPQNRLHSRLDTHPAGCAGPEPQTFATPKPSRAWAA